MGRSLEMPASLATRLAAAFSCILPSAEELARRYQVMANCLSQYGTPFDAPCSCSDVSHCWLLYYRYPWNLLINPSGLELRCHSPGRLRLTTLPVLLLHTPLLRLNQDVFNLQVVLWLVQAHACIDAVDIDVDMAFGGLSMVFFRMVQLRRHHRRLKLVSWVATEATRINDEFLALELAKASSLESLSLWGMDLTNSSTIYLIRSLSLNKNLAEVSLRSVSITKRCLEYVVLKLNRCRGIKTLDLDCRIESPGLITALRNMLSSNRNIEELSYEISGPVRFPFKALAKNRTLKVLRVGRELFEEDDIKGLAYTLRRNKRLRTLSVAICPLQKEDELWSLFGAAVGSNAGLRELDLRRANVTDLAAGHVAEGLKSNTTLQKLDMATDMLTVRAATCLAKSLLTNTTLMELRVGRLSEPMTEFAGFFRAIQDPLVSTRVYQFYSRAELPALIKLLREKCQLPQVHISGTLECPPAFASLLFFPLRVQRSLTRVSIALSTTLEQHSACHLALLFRSCETLREVDLNVYTRSAEIMTLTASIGQSKSILKLRVRSWAFDFQSASAFVEMLKKNSSINHLTIFRTNEGSDDLFIILSDAFEENYSVLDIDLLVGDHGRILCFLLLPHLRLNSFLLARAAAFFEGLWDGQSCVDNFRRLALSTPLMDRLKKNTGSSEPEIRAKIQEMLARLDD